MYTGKLVFAPVFAPVFAQVMAHPPLRDIEACLTARRAKLYHMGIRGRVARSTLADANERRRLADLCRLRPRSGRHGTSENAVKSQIRIAVSVYLLIALARSPIPPPSARQAPWRRIRGDT